MGVKYYEKKLAEALEIRDKVLILFYERKLKEAIVERECKRFYASMLVLSIVLVVMYLTQGIWN